MVCAWPHLINANNTKDNDIRNSIAGNVFVAVTYDRSTYIIIACIKDICGKNTYIKDVCIMNTFGRI